MIEVPYLSKEYIEQDAADLLTDYAQARGITLTPPIPIEDIIEKHLKLGIELDDTHRLFGIPRIGWKADILGAIFFNERRIVIDEALDPEVTPGVENLYRFTLAHEGCGHWRLHRYLFITKLGFSHVFPPPTRPSVICRTSQRRNRMEWQADYYASCLLMPPELMFAAWREQFPDGERRIIQPSRPIRHPFVEVPRILTGDHRDQWFETADEAMNRIARPFAEAFLVSVTAMRIRLEDLGLLFPDIFSQRLSAAGQ